MQKIFKKKNITHFLSTQEHSSTLSFATDAWTSANHKAYITMTIHFENAGIPVSMLLDIVEVTCSYSGFNLAMAFVKILEEFGISNKASNISYEENIFNLPDKPRSS